MKAQSVLGLGVAVFAIIVFWNADWYTLSFIFPLDPDIHMDPSVSSVTTRLKEAVNIDQPLALERVAVGYNTNLDLVCDGVKIMENLFDNQKSLKPFQSSTTIDTLEEFGSTFGFFFNQGSAAERLVSDPIVWKDIVSKLKENDFKDCSILPGGNAALMGNRFANLGVSVLLGGPVGDSLSGLLHSNITTLKKHHENIHPDKPFHQVEDEIHLIMEYGGEQKWGELQSKRANRFIVSHDVQNSRLTAVEELHEAIKTYNPQIVVIAGTHLLEILDEETRKERLDVLVSTLKMIPSDIAIHLEIAGVGDHNLMKLIAEELFPNIDSIGLNEQELGALYISLGRDNLVANDFINPTADIAGLALDEIMQSPIMKLDEGTHQLSRIHLHYLSYHLLGQLRKQRKDTFTWNSKRAERAVAAGCLATTIQACGIDGELPKDSELIIRPNGISKLFQYYQTELFDFWVAPVAACREPKRTVGLGDLISATGLAYHYGN